MNTNSLQSRVLVACGLWLAVAGTTAWSMAQADDDWEVAYTAFSAAATLAVGLTVWIAATLTQVNERPKLRVAGIVVSGLAVLMTAVGTWAVLVWMPLLGFSLALLTGSSTASRRPLATLAACFLVAPVVQILTIELFKADDGTAADLVVFLTTAVALAVLAPLSRSRELATA